MDNFFCCQHCTNFCQLRSDCTVCRIGVHAFKLAGFLGLASLVVYADQNANVVIVLADFKVFYTIARCSMNTASTAFQCYMITDNYRRKTVIQRVLSFDMFQFCTSEAADHFVFGNTSCFHCCRNQFRSHAVVFFADLDQCVVIRRSHTNCKVARNGPCCGCPDNKVNLFFGNSQLCKQSLVVSHLKFHIDRITRIVFVFDFSFCQCGVAVRAPVNRLQSLVHVTAFCHFTEYFDLTCFIFRLQCQVRITVMSQTAQTLELCHLILDMHHGEVFAVLPQFYRRNGTIFYADRLHCFQFDRQTMCIPARHIRCTEATHIFILDNEIFQCLIQSSTQMNFTIGIRRAVVKNVLRLPFIFGDHLFIQILVFPLL